MSKVELENIEAEAASAPEVNEADLRVGRRLRVLRLQRNLSLVEVAQRSGLSVGALSQIERGLSSLKVRTLWPLAAALDVGPQSLIEDREDDGSDLYIVREADRRRVPVVSEGIGKQLLSPAGAALTGLRVTVEPNSGTAGAYTHAGHEFGMVLAGEIELAVDGITYRLRAGDSFAFKSTLPHSFHNRAAVVCEIIWINTAKPSEVRNGA